MKFTTDLVPATLLRQTLSPPKEEIVAKGAPELEASINGVASAPRCQR